MAQYESQKPLTNYLTDFLEYGEVEKGLMPSTSRNYARFLKKFFQWLEKNNLAHLCPHQLSDDHIAKYRMWLARLPNSVRRIHPGLDISTQTRYLIALRSYLAYFHEKNIPCLPTEKIKLPKERRERRVKFLDHDQINKLLETPDIRTIHGLRDRAILETLFSTGMRVAEIVSLDKKQISLNKNTHDFELSIIGKGGYPRTVYFSQRALLRVRNYLAARTDSYDPLFIRFRGPTSDSMRLTVRGVELVVDTYAKRAGLPILASPHTIRHSFATFLLNEGADMRSVQEFLGHRNIATTQIYTHVTNKRLRDIHRKIHDNR